MPSIVDKYYRQIKKSNPGYNESQAWATAWSIVCKHADPGNASCKREPGEYFKGKTAGVAGALDYHRSVLRKGAQLEREIRASSAGPREKANMLHSLSKMRVFARDALEAALHPGVRVARRFAREYPPATLEEAYFHVNNGGLTMRVLRSESESGYPSYQLETSMSTMGVRQTTSVDIGGEDIATWLSDALARTAPKIQRDMEGRSFKPFDSRPQLDFYDGVAVPEKESSFEEDSDEYLEEAGDAPLTARVAKRFLAP